MEHVERPGQSLSYTESDSPEDGIVESPFASILARSDQVSSYTELPDAPHDGPPESPPDSSNLAGWIDSMLDFDLLESAPDDNDISSGLAPLSPLSFETKPVDKPQQYQRQNASLLPPSPGGTLSSNLTFKLNKAYDHGPETYASQGLSSSPMQFDGSVFLKGHRSQVDVQRSTVGLGDTGIPEEPSPYRQSGVLPTVYRTPHLSKHQASALQQTSSASACLAECMQIDLEQNNEEILSTNSAASTLQEGSENSGLDLVHRLLACADSVSKDNHVEANLRLLQVQQVASPQGDSFQRVASYFADALVARINGTGSLSYLALRSYDPVTSDEVLAAYQLLYQCCPYIKFAHFTANQAIFEAFEGEERVHIIDLEIMQGYQWPALMQALAARPNGAPHLRITGVGMPLEEILKTGRGLVDLAASLHIPFEFHAVGERLENLQEFMLQRRVGEALAVNSVNRLHRLLCEPGSPLVSILRMIREQAPKVVTLVEKEASHNGPLFLARFLEALHYYSALFDSLHATLPQTSPERAKVEKTLFSQEIINIVACEGTERLERHEKLERWRKIMKSVGFESVPLGDHATSESRALLELYPCKGYKLEETHGCLLLGWQGRSIVGASAWR